MVTAVVCPFIIPLSDVQMLHILDMLHLILMHLMCPLFTFTGHVQLQSDLVMLNHAGFVQMIDSFNFSPMTHIS